MIGSYRASQNFAKSAKESGTPSAKSAKQSVNTRPQKMFYTIDTGEQYDNIISFEIFSADKIEQFRRYNVVGDKVTVHFNIKGREWAGKYFAKLSSWRCVKDVAETPEAPQPIQEGANDLPF